MIPTDIESSFIVSNIVTHDVHIFGAKIKPGQQVDLFKAVEGLKECSVVDALKKPNGIIYLKLINGKIEIIQRQLNTFENDNPCLPCAYRVADITNINSTYEMNGAEYVIAVNSTDSEISVLLPDSSMVKNKQYVIKDSAGNASANNITIECIDDQKIDGSQVFKISGDYNAITLYSNGTNWFIV